MEIESAAVEKIARQLSQTLFFLRYKFFWMLCVVSDLTKPRNISLFKKKMKY